MDSSSIRDSAAQASAGLADDLLDLDDHELCGLQWRKTDDNADDAAIDVTLEPR